MRSGAGKIRLGADPSIRADSKLTDYANLLIMSGIASSYSFSWPNGVDPVLEVDLKSGQTKRYKLHQTFFGEKILDADTGSTAPSPWSPNQLVIPWGGELLPSGLTSRGKASDEPKPSGSGDGSEKGSSSPGGSSGVFSWIPRGMPQDPSDYLKWLLILGVVGVGVFVVDFVTKD